MTRIDHCGCIKPEGAYGANGWHWKPNPRYPDAYQEDMATEPCEAYRARVRAEIEARGALNSPQRRKRT